MCSQIGRQPTADPERGEYCSAEQRRLGRLVVADACGGEHEQGERDEHEREHAVEAAGLRRGHGSSGRTISRPSSESVQAALRGQPLQMWALAR